MIYFPRKKCTGLVSVEFVSLRKILIEDWEKVVCWCIIVAVWEEKNPQINVFIY